MYKVKLIVDSEKRFGMAEKQIAVWHKTAIEMLDHAAFGGDVEIDQNVAAENNVDALYECHACIVLQVQSLDRDFGPRLGADGELALFGHEIFFANLWRKIAG